MNAPIARGLRRIVDALQRGLFDDDAAAVAGLEPSVAVPPRAEALREVVLDGQPVAYALVRSRRRSIGFVVGAEGLVVRAPTRVPLREIDAGLQEKAGWIVARLAEQRERSARRQAARIVWRHGATLDVLGDLVRVELVAGAEEALVALDASARVLRVALPHGAAAERLRDAVESWLRQHALVVFEQRCRHFEALLGVRVTRLALSSASTRWGSANASGAVRLHWRLIHFPLATIDYVVAHELAHLREMNHGPRFWRLVRAAVPDADAARARLGSDALRAWD